MAEPDECCTQVRRGLACLPDLALFVMSRSSPMQGMCHAVSGIVPCACAAAPRRHSCLPVAGRDWPHKCQAPTLSAHFVPEGAARP